MARQFDEWLADPSTRLVRQETAQLATMMLDADERKVLAFVRGPTSVADIRERAGLPEARALQVLLNLSMKGALFEAERQHTAAPVKPATDAKYGDFVFDLRELNEDVNLDPEKKKKLLFLFHMMEHVSFYYLLGVAPNASAAEIRTGYLEKSKEFHPDAYFRRQLGTYKERIEAIFRKVKQAQDVLMNDVERRRYDTTATHFTSAERAALALRQADEAENVRRSQVRREKLLRARGFARLTMARELMAGGDASLREGKVREAMESYQLAIEADPRLNDARLRLLEARRVATGQRVESALEHARKAESAGETQKAIALLRSVIEADSANAEAHAILAGLLARTGAEPNDIRGHARRAIDLGFKSAANRIVHGEALLALGNKKLAKVEFQAALEMGDQRAKALLKQT